MPPSKPKPSEVAAETKRRYIPYLREYYTHWPTHSYLVSQPLADLPWTTSPGQIELTPPEFHICQGDPVDFIFNWLDHVHVPLGIPFICTANDKRPGGDWETGVVGYEERLCRRSNLSATLATPVAGTRPSNYPIPSCGAIYSKNVIVFRGPHENYKEKDEAEWRALPVISVPAVRWPKLSHMGTTYAFEVEKELMRDKIRGALRLCNWENHDYAVIADFGLGNSHRNPPLELAELWRDIFLYDPDIRGHFKHVAFVFEDVSQSTSQLIIDDLSKKSKTGGSSSRSKSKATHESTSTGGASNSGTVCPTDFEIFQQVFDPGQVRAVLTRPDPRYGISMLTS
ncbi:uncharacterized protein B0I36DRAFT_129455 [Microdochium trichocladiopsis]|uniref:Microbial-type PARG catalytic domain-containing protein n=1 Tax=Microdochium trichocladiopsis TaxID=1682393 RepID=A0A9P8Y4I9_9PEZI|nr:uncharacterized protein B0I36DRAFT_129455 [Microdochium trichocladiopsis]KAH7029210.1 hypothetical protein B0I36DRAFT_129455 [Microdochium trichocladiopsis]